MALALACKYLCRYTSLRELALFAFNSTTGNYDISQSEKRGSISQSTFTLF